MDIFGWKGGRDRFEYIYLTGESGPISGFGKLGKGEGGFDCNFFFIKFQSDVTGMFSF